MLENQLLVVQTIFQWEGHDLNWIHKNSQSAMTISKSLQSSKLVNKELSGRTSGQWQFVASKE